MVPCLLLGQPGMDIDPPSRPRLNGPDSGRMGVGARMVLERRVAGMKVREKD